MSSVYILLALILPVFCENIEVLQYNDDTFSEIKKYDISVGLFYSPDCTYCRKFMSHFENAMKELEDYEPKIVFFKVNCVDDGKITCEKESVPSYPHIKIYIDGEFAEEYDGERRTDNLVKYLRQHFGHSSKELLNAMDIEKLVDGLDYVVLGYFERYTGLQTAFMKASFVLKDKAKFGHITSAHLLDKFGLKNNVILFKPKHFHNKFEPQNASYVGYGDAQDLINFIQNNYHGLVGHRTKKNEDDFDLPMVVAYYEIDYTHSPKLTNYWRNRILLVANKYRNITFAVSCKFEFENDLWKLGLNSTAYDHPFIIAIDTNEVFYMMEANFSVDVFGQFVEDFIAGQLKPYIKSEPLPEDNDDAVKILVGKNFYEIMHNDKDTFIQFYTPWCMVCLEFATTYEDLALEIGEDVVIAKMNVAANDYPSFISIKSYPTFYLSRKGMFDNPLFYNGTLELAEMIKFIAKHATYELTRYDRTGNLRSRMEL
ncbi:protein disulfide isomerase [Holotrichia oblita]|uniref:Protein disulfide isomerase n=1 Tax=Holotrichia oblita TaxID=644536 RepID=A0ACB9TG98_HOLOL|nr:protein disulfide isomerase [Holotrichia oblita]